MKTKLTFLKALNYSILKWEYFCEEDSFVGMLLQHPELSFFEANCGLCEYYKQLRLPKTKFSKDAHCAACPLTKANQRCNNPTSHYHNFEIATTFNNKAFFAEHIWALLLEIKMKHQEKQFLLMKG